MLTSILTNDHFLLGVGLAVGPAIVFCFLFFLFLRHTKAGKQLEAAVPIDSLMSMEGGSDYRVCPYHSGLVRDANFAIEECKAIWLEIKDINKRQMSLRERLPHEYVSRDDLRGIQDRLTGIDQKLDRYYELGLHN